jgi:hypothetical protein
MLDGQFDEQQIVDDRKREDGRIEKRDEKQAGSPETSGKRGDFLLPSAEIRRQTPFLRLTW